MLRRSALLMSVMLPLVGLAAAPAYAAGDVVETSWK